MVRTQAQIKPHGLHFERSEELPIENIVRTAERKNEHGAAKNAIGIGRDIEEADGGLLDFVRICKSRDVGHIPRVEIAVPSIARDELEEILFASLRLQRVSPEGVPLN